MLKGVQAESGDGGGVGVPKNSKDSAFLAESVVAVAEVPWTSQLMIGLKPMSHGHLPLVPCCRPTKVRYH
jgi:hypothetical protein